MDNQCGKRRVSTALLERGLDRLFIESDLAQGAVLMKRLDECESLLAMCARLGFGSFSHWFAREAWVTDLARLALHGWVSMQLWHASRGWVSVLHRRADPRADFSLGMAR